MPTSEPDPEAQRQPPASIYAPAYAPALLLQSAYQYPSLVLRFKVMAQLRATQLYLLQLPLLHSCRYPIAQVYFLNQTSLRSDSGMDI